MQHKPLLLSLFTAFMLMPVAAFASVGEGGAGSGGTFTVTELQTIISTVTGTLNVTSIIGMIAAMITACIGIVFMWWAIRKGIRVIMSAVRKGKVSA